MRRVLAAILSITAASLLVVACGDDDGGSATPPADDLTAEAAGATEDDGSDQGSGPAAMDVSSLSGSECLKIGNALTTVVSRGIVGDFEDDLATIRSFAAGAPAETHDDFATFLGAYEASYQVLEGAGVDIGDASSVQANSETINAADELIDDPQVESALSTAEQAFYDACPMMSDGG